MRILALTLLLSLVFGINLFAGEEHQFEDGATIRVISDQEGYPEKVLNAAVLAYEKLNKLGFNRDGYAFATADKTYAYDKDKTIDIRIGKEAVTEIGYEGKYEYSTVIFIPINFDNLEGALIHELTNVILFYYNRGINLFEQNAWCIDGIARYFETLVGYHENFDAIKISLGQDITELDYDAAPFWKYFHNRFGMEVIEEISCRFREAKNNKDATRIIEEVTGVSFQELSNAYYNQ